MEDISRNVISMLEKIESLKRQYKDNCLLRKNGTLLLDPKKDLKYKHMLFKPLSISILQQYLINQYKVPIPQSYVNFLLFTNGANLFNIRLVDGKYAFAVINLCIYGVPMTPPYARAKNMEEPYDVRIEGLARHKDIPSQWFKVGSYYKNCDFDTIYNLFIDVNDERVYGCEKNKNIIIDEWNNFDECLCSIFDSFSDLKEEYIYSKD